MLIGEGTVAVKKTRTGFQIRWYDTDGRERKRTYKGITRLLAEKIERDVLAKRDCGEHMLDLRSQHLPSGYSPKAGLVKGDQDGKVQPFNNMSRYYGANYCTPSEI